MALKPAQRVEFYEAQDQAEPRAGTTAKADPRRRGDSREDVEL